MDRRFKPSLDKYPSRRKDRRFKPSLNKYLSRMTDEV